MDKQNKEFGELLKLLRKQQGLNQKELADKLYVSASAVSKWENGKNLPDLIMLKKLTEILQISYDNLLCPEEALKKLKASGKQSSEAD
ncbi:MAG: helix-turn-helix domain-containing protein, partial [Lachnospiraceae bacterium]|nr:helix-turn-helix domain-containing protein [Lachnospiraceae bacterium]